MYRRITTALAALAGAAATLTIAIGPAPTGAASAYPAYPAIASSSEITPSPSSCSVSVAPFVANVPDGGDDTAGFAAAMQSAVTTRPNCFAAGPSGDPQAVVYVPAGVYRLDNLYFPSNVRMEVSAAATLQPIQNREASDRVAYPVIMWDTTGKGKPAIRNVSLVGVGRSMDQRKQDAKTDNGDPMSGFDLSTDFTFNLDPAQTNSSNYNIGVSMVNVRYFLVQNIFSIQNNTGYSRPVTNGIFPWPTSARPVLQLHARRDSPIGRGEYLEPTHGTITNHVDVGGPRGFGPNQFNAAIDVDVSNIFSNGGTVLRIETDGSTNGRGVPNKGATVDQITARNIVGVNCNRAVSLSPHGQRNGYVTVQNVWAYSCNQAVIASRDNDVYPQYQGLFRGAVVDGVHAFAGMTAQLDSTTSIWVVGQSLKSIQIDPNLVWTPRISVVDQAGAFKRT